ncbi:sensor domain-containing diguanylate cyclase [Idiomarina aminovorans]|uniref:sensor domain-containing diguanylate cyclase n=1 Tax=Idiomarina aminovorans TaxID=2914829 RepID=UPI00200562C7|nr:sensor domain-containing diguanylate cyclase [Idiomarina sp. ATCH4]MCK7460345.1 sensor domain-containing diguanylate cyclase [Idiomarina sp. ATCH4]
MSKLRIHKSYFIIDDSGHIKGHSNDIPADLLNNESSTFNLYLNLPDRQFDIEVSSISVEQASCCLVEFINNESGDNSYLSLSSSQRLNTIIESTDAGTWEWNFQTDEIIINERWASMLGYTIDELTPTTTETWLTILHKDNHEKFHQAFNLHFQGKEPFYRAELKLKHKQGYNIWVRDYGKIVTRTENGEPEWVSGTHIDITHQKELELQLLKLSRIDSLTGLANRRYFIEQVERTIARAERASSKLSLLIIDIDLFKQINDKFGHQVGDEVLEKLARIMSERIRSSDFIARIGGEEFAVLLPNTSLNAAAVLAEELKEAINTQPIQVQEGQLNVSVTIGLSTLSDKTPNWSLLYSSADKALFQGKKQGRNRVFIT